MISLAIQCDKHSSHRKTLIERAIVSTNARVKRCTDGRVALVYHPMSSVLWVGWQPWAGRAEALIATSPKGQSLLDSVNIISS